MSHCTPRFSAQSHWERRLDGQTFPRAVFEAQTVCTVILCGVAEGSTARGERWTLTQQLLSSGVRSRSPKQLGEVCGHQDVSVMGTLGFGVSIPR